MLFFLREDETQWKHKQNDKLQVEIITINIDQDPINQLVLMLQTSYNFKSNALV